MNMPYLRWFILLFSLLLLAACDNAPASPLDPKNATYAIGGRTVTLSDGSAVLPSAPGSALVAATTIRLSDKRAVGDVNGDEKDDVVVVLTYTNAADTQYLLSVLPNGSDDSKVINTTVLSERITIENVTVVDGKITISYLDHREAESISKT